MTKDLAICAYDTNSPPREKYLSTEEFIDKVAEIFKSKLGA
jgi:isocitrate dehydrogenase